MKKLLLLFCFYTIAIFANVNDSKFLLLQTLVNQGEYEEALRTGSGYYALYAEKEPETAVITSSLLSQAAYHWYSFPTSDSFFQKAYMLWQKLDETSNEKFITGIYLADAAFTRENPILAKTILTSIKPSNSISLVFQIKHSLLFAKVISSFGEYQTSINQLVVCQALIEKLKPTNTEATNKLQISQQLALANIQLKYGNRIEADTLLSRAKKMATETQTSSDEFDVLIKTLEAEILVEKKNFAKASSKYLDAYNLRKANEEEYRKYESLKMATLTALKSGQYSEFKKLYRRTDMLSFKKMQNYQPFKPGLMYLKITELLESGQYKLALQKTNESLKKMRLLPETHKIVSDFLELKAIATENAGLIKQFKNTLDSMEILTKNKYQENSIPFAEIELKKAKYEARYGGNLASALQIYQTYYKSYFNDKVYSYSTKHFDYLMGLSNLYNDLNNHDSAFVLAQKGLKIANKVLVKNSAESQYFKASSTLFAFNLGKYKTVIDTLNAKKTSNLASVESNNYYLYSLFSLIELYQWIGEFAKTNQLIANAQRIILAKEETGFYDKSLVLDNMAKNFLINGNFLKADKNQKAVIALKTNALGDEKFMLLNSLIDKINLKVQKGELKEANTALDAAEKIIPTYYKTDSKTNAQFLFYKSKYYYSIADYKKAKEALQNSIDIHIKIYGKEHVRLVPLYTEMSQLILTENAKETKSANELYEKAQKIVENALGRQNPSFAVLLVKQAVLLGEIGEANRAFGNLQEAEKFWTSKLGAQNVNNAEIQLIRGNLYYKQKAYTMANKAYQESATSYGTIFNKNHTGYLSANTGIAKVAYMNKDAKKAAEIMEPVLDARLKFTDNNFSIMTFSQKTGFWAMFKEEFEFYNAAAFSLFNAGIDKSKTAKMYNYTLRTKGMLLNSDAKVRRQVFQSGDSSLIQHFNDWLEQKEFYAIASSYSNAELEEEKIDLIKLEESLIDLEKKINAKTTFDLSSSQITTWEDIKTALSANSVAVEMLRFRHFNHTFTDTIRYFGLMVTVQSKDFPDAVVLENGKKMEKGFLNYYRNATISRTEDENSYETYFAPLKAKIPDGYTVFFASEGVYSQLNVEMLYNNATKKYAIENNGFVFLTNTKDIIAAEVSKNTSTKKIDDYYLYGNPKFYLNKTSLREQSVPSLFGAEKEVLQIAELLKKNNRQMLHMTGEPITEDTIKSLNSPSVLHISTHGYFMERTKGGNEIVNNPMLNSGLMLAGSGDILEHADTYINQNSGILTASEVMDLNFTNTNLVVLSACETGRGQLEVGEGVFGLQRAFLVAGAKSIILSLFKVDDDATQLLMTKFYDKFLNNGGDYRKAFREAKYELRNSSNFSSPVFWGSFVMIEGQQMAQSKKLN